ncbi:MAG: gamma-glutamylcyclotransferase [Rhodospirillales bacterium]|nr:gamma-glutamylcyclotransferase [Rhodospirillales bacterium]
MSSDLTDRPAGDIWIFGYGSLMWQPNFPFAEKQHARLHGYHRALCIYSFEYRGTRDCPGLVFGLDRGGSCHGIAFRVLEQNAEAVIAYLHEREMITGVYRPRWQSIRLQSSGQPPVRVNAYIFVADRSHEQYAGTLPDEETVKLVRQGRGKSGPCIDYLKNTLDHLYELSIQDYTLARIVTKTLATEG